MTFEWHKPVFESRVLACERFSIHRRSMQRRSTSLLRHPLNLPHPRTPNLRSWKVEQRPGGSIWHMYVRAILLIWIQNERLALCLVVCHGSVDEMRFGDGWWRFPTSSRKVTRTLTLTVVSEMLVSMTELLQGWRALHIDHQNSTIHSKWEIYIMGHLKDAPLCIAFMISIPVSVAQYVVVFIVIVFNVFAKKSTKRDITFLQDNRRIASDFYPGHTRVSGIHYECISSRVAVMIFEITYIP